MNDNPWPRGSDMAAITAKAAKGVTHVYIVVSAALAATSNPSHSGRNHALLEPRLSLRSDIVRVLPRRPGEVRAPGQVSWLSDRPTPRAFPASRPVTLAGFVPDYSDGVAAVSHRLPWALTGIPGAFTVKLLECRRDCKSSRRHSSRCASLRRRRQSESLSRQELPASVLLLPDLKRADLRGGLLALELGLGQIDVAHHGGVADHGHLHFGEGERLDRLLARHHPGDELILGLDPTVGMAIAD